MNTKTLSVILFAFAALAEVILVPIYIFCLGHKKPYKLKKMICSTLFILCAIFGVIYQGGFSFFSVAMIIGLVLSWLGDLFLAVSLKGNMFVLGLGSFLLAHIAYVVSYIHAVDEISTDGYSVTVYEILIALAVIAICFVVKSKAKIELGEMKLPVLFYAATISTMLAQAIKLGVTCALDGRIHVCVIMIVAAVSFVVSDAVLVFIIFKNMHSGKTEGTNLVSYYLAQVLLASSIFFIG